MPGRLSKRLAVSLVPIVALIATSLTTAMPAGAQYGPDGDTPPYISVYRLTCPDDIAYGDMLDKRCKPVNGESVSIDGAKTETRQTIGMGNVAFADLSPNQTYTVSSAGIGADRLSLMTCNASIGETAPGYGGVPGVPVTLVPSSASFTIDLVTRDDANGRGANCHWFDVPAASLSGQPAGLIVFDSGGTPQDGNVAHRDLVLTGSALDAPLEIDTSNPNGVPSGPIVTGPILVPAGDYTLEDRANGFSTEVTLEPGHILTPDATEDRGTSAEEPGNATISFPGTSLTGAYIDLDTDVYGDEAGALYGANSTNATGTLTFDAPAPEVTTGATLTLLGLDDELPASAEISISVNDVEIYRGDSTFPAWDPNATGNQWGELALDIDPELLRETNNELVITNLSAGNEVGVPPWVMITRIGVAQ